MWQNLATRLDLLELESKNNYTPERGSNPEPLRLQSDVVKNVIKDVQVRNKHKQIIQTYHVISNLTNISRKLIPFITISIYNTTKNFLRSQSDK